MMAPKAHRRRPAWDRTTAIPGVLQTNYEFERYGRGIWQTGGTQRRLCGKKLKCLQRSLTTQLQQAHAKTKTFLAILSTP
jgi:hypothetical protein